jgi:two-component system response regulator NreC
MTGVPDPGPSHRRRGRAVAPVVHRIKVLLADDHALFRQALTSLIAAEDGIDVVGDVENGREAVRAVGEVNPDIVLMDAAMPGLNGLEATRLIRRAAPVTRVIMLTGFVDEESLVEALRAGASGYVLKNADLSELVVAIRAVNRGETYLARAVSASFNVAEALYRSRSDDQGTAGNGLTSREREVLQLVAEGYTNQGIAHELCVTVKTVEAHRSHLMTKLHTRNRTDLIRYAIRKGIVRLESVEEAERLIAGITDEG